MTEHTMDHDEGEGLPDRIVPDAATLASLAPSAILPLLETLGGETCYLCQVGYPHMNGAASTAYLVDLEQQIDDVRGELVRRALHERTVSEPEETVSVYQPQERFAKLIRARLDLPTFIARHIGLTPVGFRRVGDLLVCPCPLPQETNVDAWLWVDPVGQTFHCTGCGAWGDVSAFAHFYYDLLGEPLRSFLGREAGLPFDRWLADD